MLLINPQQRHEKTQLPAGRPNHRLVLRERVFGRRTLDPLLDQLQPTHIVRGLAGAQRHRASFLHRGQLRPAIKEVQREWTAPVLAD